MAIYKQIFPTKWPILTFFLEIWKLKIYTALFRPAVESLSYEYLILYIDWGNKKIFEFKLWDLEQRVTDRLSPLLETQEITEEKLKRIIRIATEELTKIKEKK